MNVRIRVLIYFEHVIQLSLVVVTAIDLTDSLPDCVRRGEVKRRPLDGQDFSLEEKVL